MGEAQALRVEDRLGAREHPLQQRLQALADRRHQRLAHGLVGGGQPLGQQPPGAAFQLQPAVRLRARPRARLDLAQPLDPAVRAGLAQRDLEVADLAVEPPPLGRPGRRARARRSPAARAGRRHRRPAARGRAARARCSAARRRSVAAASARPRAPRPSARSRSTARRACSSAARAGRLAARRAAGGRGLGRRQPPLAPRPTASGPSASARCARVERRRRERRPAPPAPPRPAHRPAQAEPITERAASSASRSARSWASASTERDGARLQDRLDLSLAAAQVALRLAPPLQRRLGLGEARHAQSRQRCGQCRLGRAQRLPGGRRRSSPPGVTTSRPKPSSSSSVGRASRSGCAGSTGPAADPDACRPAGGSKIEARRRRGHPRGRRLALLVACPRPQPGAQAWPGCSTAPPAPAAAAPCSLALRQRSPSRSTSARQPARSPGDRGASRPRARLPPRLGRLGLGPRAAPRHPWRSTSSSRSAASAAARPARRRIAAAGLASAIRSAALRCCASTLRLLGAGRLQASTASAAAPLEIREFGQPAAGGLAALARPAGWSCSISRRRSSRRRASRSTRASKSRRRAVERGMLGLQRAQPLAGGLERPGLLLPAGRVERGRPLARHAPAGAGTARRRRRRRPRPRSRRPAGRGRRRRRRSRGRRSPGRPRTGPAGRHSRAAALRACRRSKRSSSCRRRSAASSCEPLAGASRARRRRAGTPCAGGSSCPPHSNSTATSGTPPRCGAMASRTAPPTAWCSKKAALSAARTVDLPSSLSPETTIRPSPSPSSTTGPASLRNCAISIRRSLMRAGSRRRCSR